MSRSKTTGVFPCCRPAALGLLAAAAFFSRSCGLNTKPAPESDSGQAQRETATNSAPSGAFVPGPAGPGAYEGDSGSITVRTVRGVPEVTVEPFSGKERNR